MPKGIPLTQADLAQRRQEIADIAIPLIIEQGFNETSMRQIAQAIGLGKSTLYDYFPSKDDIIVYVVQEHIALLIQRAENIITEEGDAEKHLRSILQMQLAFSLENKAFYMRVMLEAQRLKVENQRLIQASRYAYQDLIKSLIEAGIEQGCFRPVDATMAMRTIISMMTPVIYTSRPSGTPVEMLDEGLDLILNGLQA